MTRPYLVYPGVYRHQQVMNITGVTSVYSAKLKLVAARGGYGLIDVGKERVARIGRLAHIVT